MPWLLAAAISLSSAPALSTAPAEVPVSSAPVSAAVLCPQGDPLAMIASGEPWTADEWSDCRRRCDRDRDRDCMVFAGPCESWVFANKAFRVEFERYQAALRAGVRCRQAEPTPRPSAVCRAGTCGPRAGSCEEERGAFLTWARSLPRACRDDGDCELYYIDPEPCRPPYVLQRGIDLRRDEARLAAFKDRLYAACGHDRHPTPACAPPLVPFECEKGQCRPAMP